MSETTGFDRDAARTKCGRASHFGDFVEAALDPVGAAGHVRALSTRAAVAGVEEQR